MGSVQTPGAAVTQARPKVRLSFVEKDGRAFIRVEYTDYTPIARALEARGFQRYTTSRLFGAYTGEAYRYVSNDYIVPEKRVDVKLANGLYYCIRTVDNINEPAMWFSDSDVLVINFAIFRAVPRKEGDIYVTEAPVDVDYLPCAKRFFYEMVKLWKAYLTALIPVTRAKVSVEFW